MAVGDVITGSALSATYPFVGATPTDAHLRSVITGSNAYTSGLDFYTATTTRRGFVGWRGTSSSAPANTGLYLWNIDNSALRLGTNNAERVQVSGTSNAVGIGGAPATSTVLTLTSTTGALLLPRMTTAERDALTAADGMVIYNTTTGVIEGRESGAWVNL